ncbi:MAG TPA: PA14 domain-containing protein [Kofleriaceae bacterium]|nr:PA14 domain-containing protein [Kofleriaceae bacterium]
MRRALVAVLCGACSFHHGAAPLDGNSLVDAPPVFDDGGHQIVPWVIDTAQDFAKGTSFVDVGIDPWGSLTPAGYFYGGLTIEGLSGTALWHDTDPTFSFDRTATVTPSGGAAWNGQDINITNGLGYVGIGDQTFSAWLVGEVYLGQTGTHQLKIAAADVGFLEIAPPHSTAWTQVVSTGGGQSPALQVDVTAPGWYQLRAGWANSTFNFSLSITHAAPGSGSFERLSRSQMRGRAEGPRGLMQIYCNHQVLAATADPNGPQPRPALLAKDLLAQSNFNNGLSGGNVAASDWSARWVGQFYAQASGNYTFEVDSSDGNQLAVAGAGSGSGFAATTETNAKTTLTAALAQGWNDFTLDFNQSTGNPSLQVKITDAPEADSALIGQPLPLERLRAVEPVGDRAVFAASTQQQNMGNGSQVSESVTLDGFGDETASSIVVRAVLDNNQLQSVGLSVQNPRGDSINLGLGGASGNGTVVLFAALDAGDGAQFFNDAPVAGTWKLTAKDNGTGSQQGHLDELDLAVHAAGAAEQPIATDAVWTSELIDNTTSIFSVDVVSWIVRDLGQTTTVRLRACNAPCTDSDPWTTVDNGLVPPQDPFVGKRYLQAQVEMTSDGVHPPEFEELQMMYKRDAP